MLNYKSTNNCPVAKLTILRYNITVSLILITLATARQLISSMASPSDNNSSSAGDSDRILKCEELIIRREDGSTFSVEIESNYQGRDLMRKIFEITGVPTDRQVLPLGEFNLQDHYHLNEYGIEPGATVTFITWQRYARYLTKFDVISLDGERFPISTYLSDSVASLKETLTQLTKISTREFRLIVEGKELKDERQLIEYDIWDGCSVFMGAPVDTHKGEVKIYLRVLSGATIPVNIELSVETVETLKDKIQDLTGAPKFVQLLMFNEIILKGFDYLCDYKLQAGSRVNLVFMAQQMRDLALVERLQAVVRARETPEGASNIPPRRSIYNDRRNWLSYVYIEFPELLISWFNPIAYLNPNPDDEEWMEEARVSLDVPRPVDSWPKRALTTQYRIADTMRQYRAGLVTKGERPGIKLGAIWADREEPLGANINNYAPDGITDKEIVHIFEMSEQVRSQLESDARTGEGTLSLLRQYTYNHKLLRVYLEALAGQPLADEDYQAPEGEECAMCRDSLQVQPAFKPPCGHGFHIDCALSWFDELRSQYKDKYTMCSYCRAPFRFSFATYLNDERDCATRFNK